MKVEVRDNVLYLPAESRYKARNFALTDIAACRERRYEYNLLSQLSPGIERGGTIEQVIMLPGYVGPGVEIAFLRVRKNIFNLTQVVFKDAKELKQVEIRVHFPCSRSEELVALINFAKNN